MSIDLIFAEFGRVNVDVDHFRSYFPEAMVVLYTDCQLSRGQESRFDEVKQVEGPFTRDDARYGWHMCDYWQVKGILESSADVSVAFDSDVRIVSDRIRHILPLAQKFGLCLPSNPRKLAGIDATIGTDTENISQEVKDCAGYAVNTAITACHISNYSTLKLLKAYLEIMEKKPMRAPAAWWEAMLQQGTFPCLLPPHPPSPIQTHISVCDIVTF